jgi:hypothetical protein
MSTSASRPRLALRDGFAWYEKLIARACLGGMVFAAALAMPQDNKPIALGYLAFVAVAGAIVIYDALCVYCPYPFKHSDCLFYPYQLVARFARLRLGRISWVRKAVTAVAFGGIFSVPQYWLWGKWGLFALLWALSLPLAALIPLHLCRRCRHERCPMNRVAIQ